ncbi:hypothetical protein SARC_02784 [Sphaeroforma arctica JP610]|uniref:Uncharacterized protein n=1 Tax=Sphaeroforma arctica JP610 TaxID=667725 RepID=A0A0L0G7Q7_9EUKA|nr:hypothetical protein SARC_02784 [Sphaeroforma arctica JP610]KNC85030.1 hypothetical protein SARC_02784 [Sphaeroforma arctica JP610]|eukprot:XP_014158932.1 hypothetical protein SARC_02784 [Sphaeroforma arctica JP610]
MSKMRFHNPPVKHVESPDYPSDDDLSESLVEQGVTGIHMEVPVTSFQMGSTTIKQAYTDMVVYSLLEDSDGTARAPRKAAEVTIESDLDDNEEASVKHESNESDPMENCPEPLVQREVHYISWHLFENGSHFPAAMVSLLLIEFRATKDDLDHSSGAIQDPIKPLIPYEDISALDLRIIGAGDGDTLHRPYAQLTIEISDPPDVQHLVPTNESVGLCNCGEGDLETIQDRVADTLFERSPTEMGGTHLRTGFVSVGAEYARTAIERTRSAVVQNTETDIVEQDSTPECGVSRTQSAIPRMGMCLGESDDSCMAEDAQGVSADVSERNGSAQIRTSIEANGTPPTSFSETVARQSCAESAHEASPKVDHADKSTSARAIEQDAGVQRGQNIAYLEATPDDPNAGLGEEMAAIITKVEDATRAGYVKLQDMVASVDAESDDAESYHRTQPGTSPKSPVHRVIDPRNGSNRCSDRAADVSERRAVCRPPGSELGVENESIPRTDENVGIKPTPDDVQAHIEDIQQSESSNVITDSESSHFRHREPAHDLRNGNDKQERTPHNTTSPGEMAASVDGQISGDQQQDDRSAQCNCAANAHRRKISSHTIKEVAKAFWTKPTINKGKVKQHVAFFLKRLHNHFTDSRSPKNRNIARDMRRANQISHVCQQAQPHSYVITTTVGIADIGPMAIIIDQLTEISFRNKHGRIVKRGISVSCLAVNNYSVANLFKYKIPYSQLSWALWQLYHYIDVVPQFIRWNVSEALALVDALVYGYLHKFDKWLTAFTTDFFLQYRPLYVIAVPLINRIYSPLRTCWFAVKSFFDLGLYASFSRLRTAIWAFCSIGMGPIFYLLDLVKTLLTPFLTIFGMIMAPLNRAAQYSFVTETERMTKIWRVISSQAQIVIYAVPNLLKRIFNTILRKQVEVGDIDHMDPLLKKLLENDLPHKRSSTPDGRHLQTPDNLDADMGKRVPTYPTLASSNPSDQYSDTGYSSASSRSSISGLGSSSYGTNGTSLHRRNIMSNIAIRNANSPRRSPFGSPKPRHHSRSQRKATVYAANESNTKFAANDMESGS